MLRQIQSMVIVSFLVVIVAFIIAVALYSNKYTTTFDKKIIAHYESLGYTVKTIENPKGFDLKNPFLVEVNAPVLIIEGIGVIKDSITIVKRMKLLKDNDELIVWVRLTVHNKSLEFESYPNIEG